MADWILIPCLAQLRVEFNRISPNRSKASDGSIGDSNHSSTSDHTPDEESDALRDHDADGKNEVHALDITDSGPWPDGFSMEKAVQHILRRCRSGAEKRLKYIIYNRRIWSASSGWVQQSYGGSNPHDKHAHFSGSYVTTHESNISSWTLEELVAVTEQEKEDIAAKVWAHLLKNAYSGNMQPAGDLLRFAPSATGIWNHTEPNPLDLDENGQPKPGRMGAFLRMLNKYSVDRHNEMLTLIAALGSKIDTLDVLDPAELEMLASTIMDRLPPELADRVARNILAKQGKAMTDAAEQQA